MVRLIPIVLLVGVAFGVFAGGTFADSAPACVFSGTVQAGGDEVAGGTLVTAIIDGDEYHTHTPKGYGISTYSITITPPEGENYADGTSVAFRIDGHSADHTGMYTAGTNQVLALTSSTYEPQIYPYTGATEGSSANWGVIIGLLVAFLIVGGLGYYFVLLRRVMTKGPLKRKALLEENAPGNQLKAQPAGKE